MSLIPVAPFAEGFRRRGDLRLAGDEPKCSGKQKVRDREDTFASTRDARAPRNSFHFDQKTHAASGGQWMMLFLLDQVAGEF
jgi:hypothetical protein